MNIIRLFSGLYLVIIYLSVSNENHEILHTSLANIQSSRKKGKKPSRFDCEQAASEYLEYLLLKNGLMFRVSLTERYSKLLESETNSSLLELYKRKYTKSLQKMSSIAQKIESKHDQARSLFDVLLECLILFGERYSPESIFENNKDALKYLDSVEKLGNQ
ncbi:hypothetical protein [Cryptosporidium parvum Iowa II]|uniref:Uncharacterized protein n=2 Tax=Cryptosporidium parvum TaxID=5807 RepID=Q5CWF8_CRYPI|nr:hypothetical protein [Cryptosporidium parvum Iowa II]QOY41413.1 Uncharacterized protein CPATCC_0016890 [Cryptosporidium parvum]WKS78643.1 putative signal peptide-containing protein [Cryptosporidium sp. 43IA8]EAK90096.1 hypothetical protein cgd6_5270 [Cryptosporidium parvum Iowa II]WRK33134.1 Uncharacterized protein cpbgf_6005270 [Cryptosporidium parvum]CAD98340.1 hypothetical predicted protein, unknown function [Cryptosporidium parvum]|eukprot:QOY41413.1 hypothetical protein CPATCC_003118 [Cryptosporidium parvum]